MKYLATVSFKFLKIFFFVLLLLQLSKKLPPQRRTRVWYLFLLGHTTDVLFISSNCDVFKRNQFIKILNKYINIDSRGACKNNKKRLEGHWTAIENQVSNKYKFYM